ncbi:class I SAM-dependent RNA methyltransferase [Corynebacterium aquatimens]|uniref:class I SAM-dependent RNA methyltransferase n=1 Tax=Corynebacterium aquatimens TaxID=1190508 RepID=UPI003313D686
MTKEKKRWARADLVEVLEPSPIRVPTACPAAAAGAGCCDYSHVAPDAQLDLKLDVLRGQLSALAGRSGALEAFDPASIDARALEPHVGWRTRVRLGVDQAGLAGVRRARSTDAIASEACTQPVPGLTDGLIGQQRFTPGSEVVAVRDADGTRHVVETARVQRGRRVEEIHTVIEGTGQVTERIGDAEFSFPATAFWQAHQEAPEAYAHLIQEWGADSYSRGDAWDLYGGVGAFVPAIHAATGGATVHTVDYSPAATSNPQPGLRGLPVEVHRGRVEGSVDTLPAPSLVVLDPPRSGAGEQVVQAVAAAGPERVIHIGCDPATLARDLAAWASAGYVPGRMMLVDAFGATHHFETIVELSPRGQ